MKILRMFQIFRSCIYVSLRTLWYVTLRYVTDTYGFYSTLRYVAVSCVMLRYVRKEHWN